MSAPEAAVALEAGAMRVRAGFRIVTTDALAGGPIELEFFVDNRGDAPLHVAVGADRARQRPDRVVFEAWLDRHAIDDPWQELPDLGGPLAFVRVQRGRPFVQQLLLNDYVRLERTQALLADGAGGRLELACSRTLPLAASDEEALAAEPRVAVNLAIALRRDDAALAALAARFYDDVVSGPRELRERPLAQLLSLRGAARTHIEALAGHADVLVAERAKRVLAALSAGT